MTNFKKGGPLQNSNIFATNRLFVKNPLFKKRKKKRAPGVYNPTAKFRYDEGGPISFDYDDTLSTDRGLDIAQNISNKDKYIISARDTVTPEMIDRALAVGISPGKIFATGSDKAKIAKVKELGAKHVDNKSSVVKALGKQGQQFKKGGIPKDISIPQLNQFVEGGAPGDLEKILKDLDAKLANNEITQKQYEYLKNKAIDYYNIQNKLNFAKKQLISNEISGDKFQETYDALKKDYGEKYNKEGITCGVNMKNCPKDEELENLYPTITQQVVTETPVVSNEVPIINNEIPVISNEVLTEPETVETVEEKIKRPELEVPSIAPYNFPGATQHTKKKKYLDFRLNQRYNKTSPVVIQEKIVSRKDDPLLRFISGYDREKGTPKLYKSHKDWSERYHDAIRQIQENPENAENVRFPGFRGSPLASWKDYKARREYKKDWKDYIQNEVPQIIERNKQALEDYQNQLQQQKNGGSLNQFAQGGYNPCGRGKYMNEKGECVSLDWNIVDLASDYDIGPQWTNNRSWENQNGQHISNINAIKVYAKKGKKLSDWILRGGKSKIQQMEDFGKKYSSEFGIGANEPLIAANTTKEGIKKFKKYINDAVDVQNKYYKKQTKIANAEEEKRQEYERARKKVQSGKMSTSTFASQYKEKGWSKYDPNVMNEAYKGQYQEAVNEANKRKEANMGVTNTALELLGGGAYRIVADPVGTAEGVAKTVADAAVLPVSTAAAAVNYLNTGNYNLGENPLTGQVYGSGLDQTFDVLGAIPGIGAASKLGRMTKAGDLVGKGVKSTFQNTYKINPWAVKEKDVDMLWRWEPDQIHPGLLKENSVPSEYTGRWFMKGKPKDVHGYLEIRPGSGTLKGIALPKGSATLPEEAAKFVGSEDLKEFERIIPAEALKGTTNFRLENNPWWIGDVDNPNFVNDFGNLLDFYKNVKITPHWLRGYTNGGSTDDYIEVDIPEEQIQWYIDNGYRVEPVSKLKKFIG
jgi:hypothetical protein